MQFPADDEDSDFLVPGSSRSRLSSLFQSENQPGDVNEALTFTAPKQPKKNGTTQGGLKLIHAVFVQAFKLKDGSYSSEGKLGCAILGHHETSTYKLLLYKGKQLQVTVATVSPNFVFHVQPDNYANFYDDKKENWSINFDSEASLIEFAKQVALAKANSQGRTVLVIQELLCGEGPSLENGDAAELKYNGWLLSDFTFGRMFDSNMNAESLFRLRLGKSKVIKGWHEGLLGIKKGGKRLLIVPPDLAYGSTGMGESVPPNATLIFEVYAVKLKTSHDASHSSSPIKAPDSVVEKKPDIPHRQSVSQDDTIRVRGASISEQLSQSPKKDKAQLISRMAKMGTATLPFQGPIPVQVSSDSDPETSQVPSPPPASSSPKPSTKPRSWTKPETPVPIIPAQSPTVQGTAQLPSQVSLYDPPIMQIPSSNVYCAAPFPSQLPAHYSMLQSPFPMQTGIVPTTSMMDSHLPLLINEVRNQNTDVRISLSKIEDKTDSILKKVEDIHFQGRYSNTSVPFMEGTAILQNLERIVQENARLKQDVEKKNSKIEALNEQLCIFFQKNQSIFEESKNFLGEKIDTAQKVSMQAQEEKLNLEQEKAKLQLELSSTTIKMKTLESDILKYQEAEHGIQQKLSDLENETKIKESLLKEKEEQLNSLSSEFSQLKSQLYKLDEVEEENKRLAMKIQKLEQSSSQESEEIINIYKVEREEFLEKIEQLKNTLSENTRLKNEKEKLTRELEDSVKLKNDIEAKYLETSNKLDAFQHKSRALRERYEQVVKEVKQLQEQRSVTPQFSAEIKKVMNTLYKLLQGVFEPNTQYEGSQVLAKILQTIRGLTLQVLDRHSNKVLNEDSNYQETVKNVNASTEENHVSSLPQPKDVQEKEAEVAENLECNAVTAEQSNTTEDSDPKENNSDVKNKIESNEKGTIEPIINDMEKASQPDTVLNSESNDKVRSSSPLTNYPSDSLFSGAQGAKV